MSAFGDNVAWIVSSYALPRCAGAVAAAGGEEDHDAVPSGGRRARWHGSQYIAWEWVGRSLEQFPTHPPARLGESFGLSPEQGALVLEQ